MVEAAWLNELGGTRQMMFKRFAYLAPFGTPSPVTFAGEEPDPPSLAVRSNGSAVLVWPDRISGSARLYFARYSPDSGLSSKLPLTTLNDGSQLTVSCALDSAGTLHTVWQVGGGPLNELHYQRRPKNTAPAPADTTIETAGNLLQHPAVACDDSMGVHLVYEDWGESLPRARYKLRSPTRGWEVVSTDLTVPGEGAIQPIPLPQSPYDVTNLFVSQNFSDSRLAEHRRLLGSPGTASVPTPAPGLPFLRLGPNPLPPGASLSLSGETAAPAPWVDVFDVAGRRVATMATRVSGKQFSARFGSELTSTWSAGVYFATLRGSRQSARFVVLR
jgi:hypothetical protein